MDRIQTQANKLLQIVSNPNTAGVYTQTISLTWTILKETAYLVWLVLCFGLVAGDWFWKKSYQTGKDTRTWVDTLQTTVQSSAEGEVGTGETTPNNLLSETGKSLLSAGQRGIDLALNAAKEQLGLEVAASDAKSSDAKSSETKPTGPVQSPAVKASQPEASGSANEANNP